MLARAGASHIHAVEPSAAIGPLRANTSEFGDRVTYLHARGDELPASADQDCVVSFGVLHHIPDPAPVMRAAFAALRPGGRMIAWLYGREGNELYLALAMPLRALTTRLSHRALETTSRVLELPLTLYASWCERLRLPMRDYMTGHIAELSREQRRLTIYDQLNPAYAKYYTSVEAERLFRNTGFMDVRLHHRHGYSWTVCGTKPAGS
jgi:SAM-dependent methyltransferase